MVLIVASLTTAALVEPVVASTLATSVSSLTIVVVLVSVGLLEISASPALTALTVLSKSDTHALIELTHVLAVLSTTVLGLNFGTEASSEELLHLHGVLVNGTHGSWAQMGTGAIDKVL